MKPLEVEETLKSTSSKLCCQVNKEYRCAECRAEMCSTCWDDTHCRTSAPPIPSLAKTWKGREWFCSKNSVRIAQTQKRKIKEFKKY